MRHDEIQEDLRPLVFEFFWFSRFESALKENGWLQSKAVGAPARPDWKGFVLAYAGDYSPSAAARQLVAANPLKQVIGEHCLTFADVVFADGRPAMAVGNLIPPAPVTGETQNGCYKSATSDCGGGLSREHYISRGLINGPELLLRGMPWQQGEVARYSPDNLVARRRMNLRQVSATCSSATDDGFVGGSSLTARLSGTTAIVRVGRSRAISERRNLVDTSPIGWACATPGIS